jgi:putative GTP pyrophosphokinase
MKISHAQLLDEMKTLAPSLSVLAEQTIHLVSGLARARLGEKRFSEFFKVPPTWRPKKEDSALAKLDRWTSLDSAADMIDLVGVRFVVLLRTDLDVVEQIVRSFSGWTVERSRHFEYEVADSPKAFDYQSIHLVVHATAGSTINGVALDADVSCEIQIRTLLQHAFAELCHDRIYKSDYVIPTDSKRVVARCMALMETTDLMFCDAVQQIERVQASCDEWCSALVAGHEAILLASRDRDDKTCRLLVETFWHLLAGVSHQEVLQATLAAAIRTRLKKRQGSGLFDSAGCLLTYWLLENHLIEASRIWPDDALHEDLVQVGADLGIAI